MRAADPLAIEYVANGARWRSQHDIPRKDMGSGTTGNEGDHYDLKSWGRNIMQHSRDRIEMVLKYWTMSKMVAHLACVETLTTGRFARPQWCLRGLLHKLVQPEISSGTPACAARSEGPAGGDELRRQSVQKKPAGPKHE